MAWLIFILYLLFFSWLITKIGFIRRSGLSKKVLIGLFIIKVAAGITYFQFHSLPEYRYRSDTWKFYENSLAETKKLKQDPTKFIAEIFTSNYSGSGGLFSDQNSYWNDVKDTVMIKLVAVTNLFTFDNYYANIIFFNCFFFLGLIAFYRLMKSFYPDNAYGLIAAVILVPSFLFWCSGIHKDGLVFSFIGMILYFFHALLHRRNVLTGVIVVTASLVAIFFLRNYMAIALVPSLFAGWLFHIWPRKGMLTFLILLVTGLTLFFNAKHIHPSLDFPAYVADKQQQFKQLDGNSAIKTEKLQPDASGFLKQLPQSLDTGFFRPHPWEKGMVSLMASLEIIFFWLIIIIAFLYRKKQFQLPPVVVCGLIFSFLTLLIIGFTVHFSGAVVRYRSLVMPLILAPAIGNMKPLRYIIKKYM